MQFSPFSIPVFHFSPFHILIFHSLPQRPSPPPLTSIVHSVSHNIYPCEPEREIMQWKSVQRYKFGYCFLVRGTQNHFLRSYLILELIWTQKNWIEKKNLKKTYISSFVTEHLKNCEIKKFLHCNLKISAVNWFVCEN